MQYALLGNTGLAVSRLAFGAMTFTQGNKNIAAVYKVGAKLADELVGQALDAGVNLFDTADGYASGESETLLGAALKQRRDQVVIATKVGFRSGPPMTQSGLSRRHILWSVDQSLRRLGTEWIDIYIAHREDPFTPIEETVEALDTVVRAGKVRYLGFSNWSAWKVAAALEMQRASGLAPFTHGQMYYSLLGRDVERDVIPMMRRYGLGLTVWSPLASGFLSGKYTRETLSDPDNRYFRLRPAAVRQGVRLQACGAHASDCRCAQGGRRAGRDRLAAFPPGGYQRAHWRDQEPSACRQSQSGGCHPDGGTDRRPRRRHGASAGLSELVHRPAERYAARRRAGRAQSKILSQPVPNTMRWPFAVSMYSRTRWTRPSFTSNTKQ